MKRNFKSERVVKSFFQAGIGLNWIELSPDVKTASAWCRAGFRCEEAKPYYRALKHARNLRRMPHPAQVYRYKLNGMSPEEVVRHCAA